MNLDGEIKKRTKKKMIAFQGTTIKQQKE